MAKRKRQEKRSIHQFKHKAGWTTKHHLTPKSRGGKDDWIRLDAYRHDAWHLLFGTKTLSEIIELLVYMRDRRKT